MSRTSLLETRISEAHLVDYPVRSFLRERMLCNFRTSLLVPCCGTRCYVVVSGAPRNHRTTSIVVSR